MPCTHCVVSGGTHVALPWAQPEGLGIARHKRHKAVGEHPKEEMQGWEWAWRCVRSSRGLHVWYREEEAERQPCSSVMAALRPHHRIIELLRLEKTFKIIKSNHSPTMLL